MRNKGQRFRSFWRLGTQTFIAGLTHDQLIAPWVIKGAMDGAAFTAYIREVLVPEIELKWSQKTGQRAKVYPERMKGYENGETPEVYRPV